jgi:uncharacterized protein YndB with AHSA1/START domain
MGKEFEIRREVPLHATPEQVWEAIATGPGLAAWFMPMEMDPESGMVTAWEPGKRLAVQTPEAPDGSTQAFEYLIEAREGGSTVLRFVHSGVLGDEWGDEFESMTGKGWDMYLHTLAQYLAYFPGRPAVYVEAEGPAESAAAGAWPVIARGLGLTDSPAEGDRVRLTPAGLAPIEGVVDYLRPSFIGVRTSDSLLRFHGRAALGMTVAVAQHIYSGEVDARGTEEAWTSWLHGLFA